MAYPSAFFFFNDGKQGWTERYWWFDKTATLDLVHGGALLLLHKRSRMLAKGVELPWAYISMNDQFRDIVPILPLPTPDAETGNWNSVITGATRNEPNVTLVIRCFSGSNRAGKYTYLSGISAESISYPTLYNPKPKFSGGFLTAFNNFGNELASGRWGWKATTFGAVSAPISNIVVAGSTFVVTASTSSTALKPGNKASLKDVVYIGGTTAKVNSTYTITAVTPPSTITLDWGGRDFSGFTYQGLGTISGGESDIQVIVAVVANKIGTRKRGVGFGQPHGRQKKR